MKAFFRLHDHRRAYLSNDVRLADIVSVGDATSAHNDWHVNVMTRDGIVYQMGTSDIRQLGKWRDELMHALELDAARGEPPAVTGSGYDGAMGDLAAG